MAVTNNGIMSASGAAEGGEEGIRRTFTRTYQLISDNVVTDDENAVLAAVGISLYSAHPSYSFAWVRSIRVELQETVYGGMGGPNGAIWHATVDYGWIDPAIRGGTGNPLDAPVTWAVTYEEEEQVVYQDINGDPTALPPVSANPVINKAGDYFDPPVTVARQRGILSVFLNVGSINAVALDSWGNCINKFAWNTFPPETVLLLPIEIPERQYDQETDTNYWPLVFRFKIKNPETWKLSVLNQGYRQLNAAGNARQMVYVDGVPATSPVLLNNSGRALSAPVAPANVVYLTFDVYKKLDFSVLGLDSIPDFPTS